MTQKLLQNTKFIWLELVSGFSVSPWSLRQDVVYFTIDWDYCWSLLLFNPSNCDRLPMSKMHLSSFHWSAYLTAPDTDGIYGGGSLGTRTDVFKALFVTADADKGNWPSSDMSVGPIIHIEEKKLSGIWRLLEASSTDYNSSRVLMK